MKVWEAIEMLLGMDGNKEVTVTIGKYRKNKDEPFPAQVHAPWVVPYVQPSWVIGSESWPDKYPNQITCSKVH